jgi:hypothetical protein
MIEKGEVLVRSLPRAFNNLALDLPSLSWRELSQRQSQSPMRCRWLLRKYQALIEEYSIHPARTVTVVQLVPEIVLGR